MLPPLPHHPGFALGLPQLLMIFVVAMILYGFFQLRR